MTILAIAPPMLAHPSPSKLQVTSQVTPSQATKVTWKISQQEIAPLPQTAALIYVAPRTNVSADNVANGSPNNPYGSIAAALAANPVAGTVIQLTQGVYSAETGESFPIRLPVGVTLRGEPTVRGVNTVINGGGKFLSSSFAGQDITIIANDDVRIEGITVINPNTRGTAVWVESSKRVAIANNTFINSNREGVFLTGTADVTVSDNQFKKNGANGLSAVGSSTGEIRNNIFESTGFGLAIGQKSRVNVINNSILNNVDGIVISNLSAPTLRNNLIIDNQRNGIVILKDRKGYPTPDLGTATNLGKNIFRNNLGKDLNNDSGVTQVAVGNELDPKKIEGNIAFVGETPTAPAPQIASTPLPAVVPSTINLSPNSTNPNVVDTIEITRSPQPSFTLSPTPPTALAPSSRSVFIEPANPQPAKQPFQLIKPSDPIAPETTVPVTKIKPEALSQNSNEILIDRDPIPVKIPQPATPPKREFILKNPSTPPAAPTPDPFVLVTPPSTTPPPVESTPIPYNQRVAALVPPPAIDRFPYLVVIPSSDSGDLNRVRSVVPSAKIIPSRFGNIIMVQGYPDRDRAEVLKTIMRSEIGLDARVVHQNNL
jgi:parallel beta-helix repeat protein